MVWTAGVQISLGALGYVSSPPYPQLPGSPLSLTLGSHEVVKQPDREPVLSPPSSADKCFNIILLQNA
jgi:hypothetical protein